MKAYAHKAKIAYLMNEAQPSLFLQLEDGRVLIVEISQDSLSGLLCDGIKRLTNFQPGASASSFAQVASASEPTPAPDADAFIPQGASR